MFGWSTSTSRVTDDMFCSKTPAPAVAYAGWCMHVMCHDAGGRGAVPPFMGAPGPGPNTAVKFRGADSLPKWKKIAPSKLQVSDFVNVHPLSRLVPGDLEVSGRSGEKTNSCML